MNSFSFCKMQGTGNDFVVVDNFKQTLQFSRSDLVHLADRHCGIGFDQFLLLSPSTQADLRCHIFNADGSEAKQCGNGLRCVARFVHEEKIISKTTLSIEIPAGVFTVDLPSYDQIRVNMGIPKIKSEPVYCMLEKEETALTTLSLGNTHAIHRVSALKSIPLATWGPIIESHAAFSEGVNSGFIEIESRTAVYLRTHERGVGETRACGSNACAAVVTGILNGWLDSQVEVHCKGGSLQVNWAGLDQPVFLTGPATRVFVGSINPFKERPLL